MEKEISRESAETLFPQRGAAANDPIIISHLNDISSGTSIRQEVMDEIDRNAVLIEKLSQKYPEINFSTAFADLKQDKTALAILTDRSHFQDLLLGKSIQYQRVSIGSNGLPKRNFGMGLLSLTRKIDSLQPTVSLGYSPMSGLNPKFSMNRVGETHLNGQRILVDQESLKKVVDKFQLNAIINDRDLKRNINENNLSALAKMLQLSVKKVPIHEQAQYRNELSKTAFVSNTKQFHNTTLQKDISLLELPFQYKGVNLNKKQMLNLAQGLPVHLTGLKDPKINRLYDAVISINIFKPGQTVEKSIEEVKGINKREKQQAINHNQPDSFTKSIANSYKQEENEPRRKPKHRL